MKRSASATEHSKPSQDGAEPLDLELIYSTTVDDVQRYIAKRSWPDDVDDLVADTYVRAFRSINSYTDEGLLINWLTTIASNVIKSRWSKEERRRQLRPTLADERTAISVPERVAERDDARRIRDCLSGMREQDRRVLELRFVHGKSAAEAGDILGLSAGAVRTRSYRALQELREIYCAEGGSLDA